MGKGEGVACVGHGKHRMSAPGQVHDGTPRGRHVQAGLLLGAAATPPLPMDRVVAQELVIYGSHGMAAHDYPGLLDLVRSGRVEPAAPRGTSGRPGGGRSRLGRDE